VTHDIDEAIKMGDLVVVMRQGGHIAQAGPPADLLASPANDFVARFVGADRGLKRLSLFRVGDVPLEEAVTVHEGEPVADLVARAADAAASEILVLDDADRPIGWIPVADLPSEGRVDVSRTIAKSPFLDRRTTLKDATSMLLEADVPAGLVVDRNGRLRGVLTFAAIVAAMRDERDQAEAVAEKAAVSGPVAS
jgi:osmoprotectant transport system ATP-binding protein